MAGGNVSVSTNAYWRGDFLNLFAHRPFNRGYFYCAMMQRYVICRPQSFAFSIEGVASAPLQNHTGGFQSGCTGSRTECFIHLRFQWL